MKEYYISLKDGTKVPVTEEVYRAYKQHTWREHKKRNVRSKHECSLEQYEDYHTPVASDELLEKIVTDKILIETLLSALTPEERFIIDEIYFHGQSERDIAKKIQLSNVAVNKKHHKILDKLRNLSRK